ncbi:MAG: ExeA family protein [Bacteroidales bacterium]
MENSLYSLTEKRLTEIDRLGLKEDPFKLAADPRFLYLGPEHLVALRHSQSVILRRKGLAVCTGEPGTGKSSLARRLFDWCQSENNIDVAYIPRASFNSDFQAVKTACNALASLEIPEKRSFDQQLEALKQAIVGGFQQQRNVVIIFDDVQEMSKPGWSLIHELYNFDVADKTVQTFVFGQTETIGLISKYRAVEARVSVWLNIPPLTAASAQNMIMFRTRTAGRSEPLLQDDAFELLFDFTMGIPRKIILLCSIATDLLLDRRENYISKEIMREAIKIYGRD